jgi:chemotaxis protein MotB
MLFGVPMMTRSLTRHRASLGLLLGCSLSLSACGGHSEEEWQAQLDKYNQLSSKNQATEDELAELKARAEKLKQELEAMGFKLSAEGEEKQKLMSALEEYKERAAALERIKARLEMLKKKLEGLTKLGLTIQIRKNRMVISLPGDVLFASGKDELQTKGKDILALVAKAIREDDDLSKRTYQVAGHTDNEKIQSAYATKEFKDNWGLSLMRARTVLLYLVAPTDATKNPGGGLNPKLWSASGYGETDPIASNAGKYGREKNRRVELIMMPNVEEMLDLKSLVDSTEAEAAKAAEEAATAAEEDAKKADAKPGTSADAKPADAKPADAKPADAKKPQ